RWRKQPGDAVNTGDVVCESETDKATIDVESPASGTMLEHFFREGDDVPVMVNIAAVGTLNEDIASLRPANAAPSQSPTNESQSAAQAAPTASAVSAIPAVPIQTLDGGRLAVSPRARHLAERKEIDFSVIQGTGPGGRIIERD